jgi:hypothetical protein
MLPGRQTANRNGWTPIEMDGHRCRFVHTCTWYCVGSKYCDLHSAHVTCMYPPPHTYACSKYCDLHSAHVTCMYPPPHTYACSKYCDLHSAHESKVLCLALSGFKVLRLCTLFRRRLVCISCPSRLMSALSCLEISRAARALPLTHSLTPYRPQH